MKKKTMLSDVLDALTLRDLCRFCKAEEAWVIELLEHGVLDSIGTNSGSW